MSGHSVPGPQRHRSDTMGNEVETSPERIRHHLRRPHASGRGPIAMTTPLTPLAGQTLQPSEMGEIPPLSRIEEKCARSGRSRSVGLGSLAPRISQRIVRCALRSDKGVRPPRSKEAPGLVLAVRCTIMCHLPPWGLLRRVVLSDRIWEPLGWFFGVFVDMPRMGLSLLSIRCFDLARGTTCLVWAGGR